MTSYRFCYYRTLDSDKIAYHDIQTVERIFDFADHADRNRFARFMGWCTANKVDVLVTSTQILPGPSARISNLDFIKTPSSIQA